MHDRAGQRPIGSRTQAQGHISLFHGRRSVDVDDHDLGAALLAGAHGVGHHIDLCRDRIGAPDHHTIGLRHFARVRPRDLAKARHNAGPCEVDADGAIEARILFRMGETIEPIAHHAAHGARIIIGPDALRPMVALGGEKTLRDEIQRLIPRDALELARALLPHTLQGIKQTLGMMDALGVAGDLGADDASRIGLVLRAANAPDALALDDLHIQRAGRGAIMGADGGAVDGVDLGSAHAPALQRRAQKKRGAAISDPSSNTPATSAQPTISFSANHWAISMAAVSGASEP